MTHWGRESRLRAAIESVEMSSTIDDVRSFWQENPLWAGKTAHAVGSRGYFEEHRRVYIEDCFVGRLDDRIFPPLDGGGTVLDLGCGPGFWTVELGQRSHARLVAADLTVKALDLARQRCVLYGIRADFSEQNAEKLAFTDETFAHVNCQGVIHHTPDTDACAKEIARVLKPEGTACISVYYRNALLRMWPLLRLGGRLAARLGTGLRGRGRENIVTVADVDELVRMYDGKDNPIGKCYSRKEFLALLEPYFRIRSLFFHFFPVRALPIRLPRPAHRALERMFPFMVFAFAVKR